jgi:hypothetical protein
VNRRREFVLGGKTCWVRIRIQGRRSEPTLPQGLDDIVRYKQRSWKKHRRMQYKVSDMSPDLPPLMIPDTTLHVLGPQPWFPAGA